jgi:hypothetical protein
MMAVGFRLLGHIGGAAARGHLPEICNLPSITAKHINDGNVILPSLNYA